ncbi:MAG: ABC transporter substrate-binding protein [Ilumatobacteraceae bacterium]
MRHTQSTRRHRRAALATLLAVGLIATACGGSDGGDDSSSNTTATTAAESGDSGSTETTEAQATTTAAPPTTAAEEADLTPVPGGDLVMAIEAESSSPWRPAETGCAISCHQIMRSVYDTLAVPGADNLPHPYLASAITPNEDFTVWTITARDGVKFHDGTDFDGAAIVENLSRHKTALLTGPAIMSVTDISLDPNDPMSAVVTVSKPWATFPFYLTGQLGYMASPTWLAASDTDEALRAKPVGTGPFIFEDYVPNEYFKAKKNPDYWNKPYPYLDSIEFRPIADGLTRRDALKAGDVDLIHTSNYETQKEFEDNPDEYPMTLISYKGETGYTLLHVTQEGSPLNDQRVRCALANASDSQLIIDTIYAGVPQLANGPFSPSQVGYLEDSGYPVKQDMEKAKALIAEYKAENPGPLTLALATTNDQTNLVVANFQKQWFEEAGIDEVTIDQIDQGQYIVVALLGNFQVFQWRQHGGIDLDQQYFWWHSEDALPVGTLALNFGRIKDPNLDALLDANRASTDPAEKQQIAEDVNRLFGEQCYNLWGNWTRWALPHKPGIHGLEAVNLSLPDGGTGLEGAGIAGTYYPQTVWMEQ